MERRGAQQSAREDFMQHKQQCAQLRQQQAEMAKLRQQQTEMAQTLSKAKSEKNKKQTIIEAKNSELIQLKHEVSLTSFSSNLRWDWRNSA